MWTISINFEDFMPTYIDNPPKNITIDNRLVTATFKSTKTMVPQMKITIETN